MLKTQKKAKLISVPIKMTEAQKAELQKKADKYTEGNFAEWLRFAGTNHVPRKKDLV